MASAKFLKTLVRLEFREIRKHLRALSEARFRIAFTCLTTKELRNLNTQIDDLLRHIDCGRFNVKLGLFELMNSGISHRRFLQFVREVEQCHTKVG